MASYAGLRGSGKFAADERPKDWREGILWSEPNGQTPLTALMSKMGSESTSDPEFNWWEEKLDLNRVLITTAMSSVSTAVTMAGGGGYRIKAGDLLLVETDTTPQNNEIVQVTAVGSDTAITVTREAAGTAKADIPQSTYATVIGSAYEEGSTAPAPNSRNPTKLFNYTQIFKETVGITNTADAIKNLRTGKAWENDRKRKSFDLAQAMEYAFIFGRRSEVTSGTHPKRTTGGIVSFLSTNVKDWTETPTEESLLEALQGLFLYQPAGTPNERIVFAGNGAINTLNLLAKNSPSTNINYDGLFTVYGMKLSRWVIPQGEIAVKSHPLFNIHPVWTNSMLIINPKGIKERYLRKVKFMDNIQANDEDARRGQWIGETGVEVHHEDTMGFWTNFKVFPEA